MLIYFGLSYCLCDLIGRSLLNCVTYVPTCQRALRAYVLAYQRPLRAYLLTCQRALCAYVLTGQRALRAYVLTRQCALRAYVLKCQRALRAYVPFVSMCSRAITTNNKTKFSIICFPYIFVIVLSFFFLWNKTVIYSCIVLTKWKPLTGAMTDFLE